MQNLKSSLLWQRHNVTAWQYWKNKHTSHQRWSSRECPWPRGRFRGHILNSLASKPQVLKNCSVLGSRTALFFEPLKSCWKTPETSRKICEDLFLFCSSENHLKKNFRRSFLREKNFKDLFLWRILASVSSVRGLALKRVCPWPRNFFVFLALASNLISSTPPLLHTKQPHTKYSKLFPISFSLLLILQTTPIDG